MNAGDVGHYFLGPEGGVWRMIGYCALPTATLECVYDAGRDDVPPRVGGAVGAPIFDGFRRLTPEPRPTGLRSSDQEQMRAADQHEIQRDLK